MPALDAPIYGGTRWSTDEQGDGSTETRQREAVTAYSQLVFGREPDHWVDDPGVSAFGGHNLDHGNIARFARDVVEHRVSVPCHLIYETVDRLSRAPVMKANAFCSALIQAGVVLHVARRRFAIHKDDPNAIMALLPLLIDAEGANRDNTNRSVNVQKNVDSRYFAMREGRSTFMDWGPAWTKPQRLVDGSWVDVQSQGRGAKRLPGERRFVFRDDRYPTLMRICELAASGLGGMAIAKALNADLTRYPPWKATMWHSEAIIETVRSRALIGEYQPHSVVRDGVTASGNIRKKRVPKGDVKHGYYPSIPLDLWQRMEAARHTNGRTSAGRPSPRVTNLFAGLCRCAVCGSAMQTTGNEKRGFSLICRSAKGAKCSCVSAWKKDPRGGVIGVQKGPLC